MTLPPTVADFQVWLEGMHPRLARFQDFLLPVGMLRNYSRASLVELEQLLLVRWAGKKAFKEDPDTDFIDGAIPLHRRGLPAGLR